MGLGMKRHSAESQPAGRRANRIRSPVATEPAARNPAPRQGKTGQKKSHVVSVGVAAHGSGIFTPCAWAQIARSLDLSGRELQIVRGIFDDQTEFAIAGELGISPHTVHTHLSRLHHKLGVVTRTQVSLRVMAEFMGLTSAPGSRLPPLCGRRSAGECSFQR